MSETIHPSITIINEPAFNLVSPHNCVPFNFESARLFINSGVKSNASVSVSGIMVAAETLTIFGEVFIAAVGPNLDGLTIVIGSTSEEQTTNIFETLKSNFNIVSKFVVVKVTPTLISIIAIKIGIEFSTNISDTSANLITLDVSGQDLITQDNYSIVSTIWFKKVSDTEFTKKISLVREPVISGAGLVVNDNIIEFNIQELLKNGLSSDKPDLTKTTIFLASNMFGNFYLIYGDFFGTPPVAKIFAQTKTFALLFASWQHDKKDIELTEFDPNEFGDGYRFLSAMDFLFCLQKDTKYFLYLYIGDINESGGQLTLLVDYFFKGGVSVLRNTVEIFPYTNDGVAILPVGPQEIDGIRKGIFQNAFTAGDNGTFESGIADMLQTGGIILQDSDESFEGDFSLEYEKTGSTGIGEIFHSASTLIKLEANLKYKFTCAVRIPTGSIITGLGTVKIRVKDNDTGLFVEILVKQWQSFTDPENVFVIIECSYTGVTIDAIVYVEGDQVFLNRKISVDSVKVFVVTQLDHYEVCVINEMNPNLFVDGDNGTMEANISGLASDGAISQSASFANTGTQSANIDFGAPLAVDVNKTLLRGNTIILTVKPNTKYRVRAFVYVDLASITGSSPPVIKLVPLTTGGFQDFTNTIIKEWGPTELQVWTEIISEIETGNDTDATILLFLFTGDTVSQLVDKIFVDDITFKESPATEKKLFKVVDCDPSETFYFLNEPSGFDNMLTNKILRIDQETEQNLVNSIEQCDYEVSEFGEKVISSESNDVYETSTQNLRKDQEEWLRQFLKSTEIYWERNKDGVLHRIIIEDNIHRTRTNEGFISVIFRFRTSYKHNQQKG